MFPGKVHLIRPVLHHRNREDDEEYGEHCQQDQAAQTTENRVAHYIFPNLNIGNLIVADIVFLQIMKQCDGHDGWDEHQHRHGGTGVKVRNASEHLIIKHRRHHIVLSTHRRRNTVVGKT